MRRAAIYARVSTTDRGQDPETQLRQLREYAERRGFSLAHEYVDHASGAKNDRAEYRAMLEAARKRGFDAQSGEYVDLVSRGIIDPTKVVRNALQGAASVAGLLITTEAMVAEKPQKREPAAGGPGGGMGGMGGMGDMDMGM